MQMPAWNLLDGQQHDSTHFGMWRANSELPRDSLQRPQEW